MPCNKLTIALGLVQFCRYYILCFFLGKFKPHYTHQIDDVNPGADDPFLFMKTGFLLFFLCFLGPLYFVFAIQFCGSRWKNIKISYLSYLRLVNIWVGRRIVDDGAAWPSLLYTRVLKEITHLSFFQSFNGVQYFQPHIILWNWNQRWKVTMPFVIITFEFFGPFSHPEVSYVVVLILSSYFLLLPHTCIYYLSCI